MFVYGKFLLEGFDWENLGVLDRWLFMGGCSLTRDGYTERFYELLKLLMLS